MSSTSTRAWSNAKWNISNNCRTPALPDARPGNCSFDVVVRDEFVDRAEVSRTDSLEELTGQGLVGIGHRFAFLIGGTGGVPGLTS
jgi:hypothetical protein